jgi:hypothetical protein
MEMAWNIDSVSDYEAEKPVSPFVGVIIQK